MQWEDDVIKEALLNGQYVSEEDIAKAESFASNRHVSIVDFLFEQDIISSDLLGQALAEHWGVPYADLNSSPPGKEQVLRIPVDIAQQYRAILFTDKKKYVTVTTDDPTAEGLAEVLAPLFDGRQVTIAFSLPDDIDQMLLYYRQTLETRFGRILEESARVAPDIIDEIISDAVLLHVSDIHFEPQGEEVVIRFRLDGILQEAARFPKQHYENILNRIKVQAHLRIDEHYSAQDGAIRYDNGKTAVDMRISLVPTVNGEKVVIRLLSQYVQGFTIRDLGLSDQDYALLTESAKRPFGMILVTGPTGSGKTTSLYAVLKALNNPDINITTIEDPVEYKLPSVNQIQVNAQTNLTFAQGLRSVVRQDPDVILVGEIRDEETAEIAVNAALTGHLLLSTFHANDAATAIPRLLDMDVEPFLLSSTLNVVIAQRLVRRICEDCRVSENMSVADLTRVFSQAKQYFKKATTLYRGRGCNTCHNTGYKGRVAIFEMIMVTPELQALIMTDPSSQAIWKLATQQGARRLFDDGIEKVKNGVTSIEELMRVAPPPIDL